MLTENEKKQIRASLLCDVLIVLLGADGTAQHFTAFRWAMFQYYTLCSNLFLLLACAVCAWYEQAMLRARRFFVPSWARVLKYFAVCTVMVTFFVALLILPPLYGGFRTLPYFLFSRGTFAHHFACPLLGALSLLFADGAGLDDRRLPALALLPTMLYALAATALNVARVLHGPYPFLYVYEQPVLASALWYAAILGLAYLLAWGVWRLNALLRRGEAADFGEAPPPEARGWSEDGYAVDQDCFWGYTYRTIPASDNGCGPIAAYNLRRRAGQGPSLAEVFAEMDAMHPLCVPGPTHTRVMRAYLAKYLPGMREAKGREASLAAARGSAMGVFRYWEQRVPHFAAYYRADGGRFRFFNVCDGAEDSLFAMEDFVAGHCAEGPVRLLYWGE